MDYRKKSPYYARVIFMLYLGIYAAIQPVLVAMNVTVKGHPWQFAIRDRHTLTLEADILY